MFTFPGTLFLFRLDVPSRPAVGVEARRHRAPAHAVVLLLSTLVTICLFSSVGPAERWHGLSPVGQAACLIRCCRGALAKYGLGAWHPYRQRGHLCCAGRRAVRGCGSRRVGAGSGKRCRCQRPGAFVVQVRSVPGISPGRGRWWAISRRRRRWWRWGWQQVPPACISRRHRCHWALCRDAVRP